MYKIMLVDDEGIVLDSMKYIIESEFGAACQIELAKTGHEAIERAESFQPDIVFMDIHMPGVNGIEAMKEIEKKNRDIRFIVLSAYERFEYAKQAVNLGVYRYMVKPFTKSKVLEVLGETMNLIDCKRQKISDELKIKEKLKSVIPVLENGFVNTIMFRNASKTEIENYRNLLEIGENYGYAILMEYGDEQKDGSLTNPIGVSVKMQKIYHEVREMIKEIFLAYISQPMANRLVIYVPYLDSVMDYGDRVAIIENARTLTRKLMKHFTMQFKIGIGSNYPIEEIQKSYQEAVEAVRSKKTIVTHIQDIAIRSQYEATYPIGLEDRLFDSVSKGNIGYAVDCASQFFEWMITENGADSDSICLKVLEFVMRAETLAYKSGGLLYQFNCRANYLKEIMAMKDYPMLKKWFLDKVTSAADSMGEKEKKQERTLVECGCRYIQEHFSEDISLDTVAREVNISPYYFSKMFKEEMNENFVDYVTDIRMENAKKLLKGNMGSIKEICSACGYNDPNYFSRTFKKLTGVTPTEYREEGIKRNGGTL